MGSGNSVPVERARTVETEAHQDVFELRLDHLAMGSTAILILVMLFLIYWCRQKRKSKRREKVTQTTTCCHREFQPWMTMTPPMMPAMGPPRYMEMMPMPMATMPPYRYEDPRFMEIYEEPPRKAPPNGPGAAHPSRPPLPEPVPRLQAAQETPKPGTK